MHAAFSRAYHPRYAIHYITLLLHMHAASFRAYHPRYAIYHLTLLLHVHAASVAHITHDMQSIIKLFCYMCMQLNTDVLLTIRIL
jgi:hypothetical protein